MHLDLITESLSDTQPKFSLNSDARMYVEKTVKPSQSLIQFPRNKLWDSVYSSNQNKIQFETYFFYIYL